MRMDPLAQAVREQLALGRLLPLGAPGEALWIAESAARSLLRRAAGAVAGVRVGDIGIRLAAAPDGLTGTDGSGGANGADGSGRAVAHGAADGSGSPGAVMTRTVAALAPAGALPHEPLQVVAAFDAVAGEPLPALAEQVRFALWTAVRDGLGVRPAAVDLRVTGLFDPASEHADDRAPEAGGDVVLAEDTAKAVGAAVRAVPGVSRLTCRLPGFAAGVRVREQAENGSPSYEVRVQIAVAPGSAPVAVARAAAATAGAAAGRGTTAAVTTAVVVTDA